MTKLSTFWNLDVNMRMSYAVTRLALIVGMVFIVGMLYGWAHGYLYGDYVTYVVEEEGWAVYNAYGVTYFVEEYDGRYEGYGLHNYTIPTRTEHKIARIRGVLRL